jgi:hypothetical protein
VTELDAFKILFGLDATQVGGGGLAGSEGAVTIVVEGEKESLDRSIRMIETIKGEEKTVLVPKKSLCSGCLPTTPSMAASAEEQFAGRERIHCMFTGKKEEDLPPFFRRP